MLSSSVADPDQVFLGHLDLDIMLSKIQYQENYFLDIYF